MALFTLDINDVKLRICIVTEKYETECQNCPVFIHFLQDRVNYLESQFTEKI